MLYYDRNDLGKGIDLTEIKISKEFIVYPYWYFNRGSKFQKSVCNGCHDLLMRCLNINDIIVITDKGIDYRCVIHGLRN